MNTLKAFSFVAMLGSAAAFAQTPPPPDPPPARTMDLPEFRSLDINGDGQLSKDEARANTEVTRYFVELDVDKDNVLTPDEYSKAKQLIKPTPPPSPPEPPTA